MRKPITLGSRGGVLAAQLKNLYAHIGAIATRDMTAETQRHIIEWMIKFEKLQAEFVQIVVTHDTSSKVDRSVLAHVVQEDPVHQESAVTL